MHIEISRRGNVTVAAPKCDLTGAAAAEARKTFASQITPDCTRLLLDMTSVGYVDSSGLAAIVATMKQARDVGGDVRVCRLQPDVRSIFEMTRLTAVMSIHSTRDEAVASWG
jgi:anti-anti-sigma factor